MKTSHSLPLALLATLATATPAFDLERRQVELEKRQFGYTYDELKKGDCKDVTFIWTRGTMEIANMGEFVGGRLVPYLKKVFPSIAIQGVEYGAGITGNLLPGGGDLPGIAEATKMYNLAVSKCPNTIITGGGYSQGAAITHRSVEKLPEKTKSRIAGITLYGDTQFYQDKGVIKNFPAERVKVFCNGYGEFKSYSSDGVCNGLLLVNYGHMTYGDALKPGADWLKKRVDELKSSSKGSSSDDEPKPKKKAPKPKPVEEEPKPAPKKAPKPKAEDAEEPKPKKKASKPKDDMAGMDMRADAEVIENAAVPQEVAQIEVPAVADVTYTAGAVPAQLA